MPEEVSGEDGVAPGGKVDADLLEEPAGVGSVAMGHVNGSFNGFGSIQWKEALREEFAIGSFEE